jgi:hypothetical protein
VQGCVVLVVGLGRIKRLQRHNLSRDCEPTSGP